MDNISENKEILRAEGVSFSYRSRYQTVDAVKHADCGFMAGRSYAIVGKSGSGKTTFLSLLAGLELPTEGTVFFEGVPTSEMDTDAYRRDRVAVIYQSYNLFPMLTAEENVLYPLKLKRLPPREARERAEAALASVGIGRDQFARFPSQLSGGEQQRVAIARAIAAESAVLLADEPTGNLDIANGEQVVRILLSLAHEKGRCVIVVTHDLEIAVQMDEVYMMKDGVLELGEA